MDHTLSLEIDQNLINKILDNTDMRYIILYLHIIRNNLFDDLNDPATAEAYDHVLSLNEIFKGNLTTFWDEEFTATAIDLGLVKNIRSVRELEQKEDDFIIKLGQETVTIEGDTISVPNETLFRMITKKFKNVTRRDFNTALTRLQGLMCESTGSIHPFIFKIGEKDYAISDDLYYILDECGNTYQTIKVELTIEGFYQRYAEIADKIDEFIQLFDLALVSKTTVRKLHKAFAEDKDIMELLGGKELKLSDKFEIEDIDTDADIYKDWSSKLIQLLKFRYKLESFEKKLLEIKSYYSGKKKKCPYLEFINKISFDEDGILGIIQSSLNSIRSQLIDIKEQVDSTTKKDIRLLNLDYERFILTSGE